MTGDGKMEIFKEFTFDAAHHLPNMPEGHKCGRLHGHSFHVSVYVKGPVDEKSGWVQDYADIKTAFSPILDQLDHFYLNKIEGLQNPTSENIARWIWWKLLPELTGLCRIVVRETASNGCVYCGEKE